MTHVHRFDEDGFCVTCGCDIQPDPEADAEQTRPTAYEVCVEADAHLALLRQRNAELLAENTKLRRLVATQRVVIEACTAKVRS